MGMSRRFIHFLIFLLRYLLPLLYLLSLHVQEYNQGMLDEYYMKMDCFDQPFVPDATKLK